MIHKIHKKIRVAIQLSLSVILTFLLTLPTSAALSDSTLDFYNKNGIYYYNSSGSDYCTIGTGSYDGSTSAGLSETQAAFVDTYHDIAQQLSVEYGIPWETVVAQGILESAAGTSSFAVNRNNFFGIGAFDSNPNNAFSYATPEEGWRGYYENIRKTSTYRNHGVFQEPNITDPYAYTQAIKDAGYATDPSYVTKVHSLIAAIEIRSQERGWLSSAALAAKYPEMLTNAANYAAGAGEAPSADISYGGGACLTRGNGDINQTALELSWPDRTHDVRDPNDAYKAALAELGISSAYANNADWSIAIGSSCDVFVSTVMQYSGVDPNYPLFLGGQVSYLPNHPELYQYVGRSDQNIDYQPGDIRINRAHTELVVLLEDGQTLAIASASHQDRTADHKCNIYPLHQTAGAYDVYRHI